MYRIKNNKLEVFLVHPGGPYWKNKDVGAWGIPKGEVEEKENLIEAAKREFEEETSIKPNEKLINIGNVNYKNGKTVYAWAFQTNIKKTTEIKSNTFEIEFPPKSGKMQSFPEIDRGEFFSIEKAKNKIMPQQMPFIENLEKYAKQKKLIKDEKQTVLI